MLKTTLIAIWLLLFWGIPNMVAAQDDTTVDEESSGSDRGKHRLDFTLIYLDSLLFNSLAVDVGYSYALTEKTQINANLPYLDTDIGGRGGSGIGDMSLAFSWAPLTKVSVDPWVPQRFGTGISVTLPTGDASEFRSLDATIVMPFVGLVIPMSESFSLLPSAGYVHSLDSIITGDDIRLGLVDLGINWVSNRSFWITAYSAYIRDFETDENYLNTALSVGTVFSENWGASIDWDGTDYFVPGGAPVVSQSVDAQISLNIHYNF